MAFESSPMEKIKSHARKIWESSIFNTLHNENHAFSPCDCLVGDLGSGEGGSCKVVLGIHPVLAELVTTFFYYS